MGKTGALLVQRSAGSSSFRLENLESSYVPVPARPAVCGLPPPSSLTERLAERDPATDGVKFTPMEQLAPVATLVPQLFT